MNDDIYNELFINAPAGYIVCGIGGEIIDANLVARGMLLPDGDFPPGARLVDYMASEYHGPLADFLRGFASDEALSNCVVSPGQAGSGKRYIRINGRMVSGGGFPGNGDRLLLMLADVTREMQEIRALRISEEKYWAMMNFGSDAIIMFDYDGIISEANLKALALFGYARKGFLGTHLDALYPPELYPQYKKIFDDIMLRGTASVSDIDIATMGGGRIPVDITGSVVEYGGKSLIQMIFRDISEKKKAEQALRESEERYRKLVELAPDGIGIHVDGKLEFMNETGLNLAGFDTPEAAKGFEVINLIHPDDREKVLERMKRILISGEKLAPVRERVLNVKGREYYAESNSVVFDYQGRKAMMVYTRDITDKMTADEALRYSEETTRALLNATTDRIALLDTSWNILAVNNASIIAGGVSAEELIGKNILEILPKELVESRRVKLAEAVATGKPLTITDIERDHVTVSSVYPIVNDRGKVERIAIYARDITEQVNAEKALRYSEETNRALLNATTDRIILVDPAGCILTLNNALAEIRGISVENLIGKNIFKVLPADVAEFRQEKLGEVVESGKPLSFTDEENGRVIVSSLYPVVNDKGLVERIAVFARDITEQINAESEKSRLLSEMNQIFSISTIGLCLIRNDCTILRANNTYLQMFGFKQDITGHKCTELPEEEQCRNGRCLLKLPDKKTEINEYEVSGVREGIEYHYLVSEVSFYNPKGVVIGMLRSVADITAIRRLEKELITVSDRERQLIGQDLHDEIGQIMTGMAFMIEKLEKRLRKNNYPETTMAAEINGLNNDAIEKMRDIIKGLDPVLLSENDLMPALSQLADDTFRLYGSRVKFSRDIPPECLDMRESTQVYYIIREAIHNAIKHGRADMIEIGFTGSPGFYEVVITNNTKEQVRKKKTPSSGMGVSIMKYRAEMIGADFSSGAVDGGYRVSIKKA